MGWNTQENTETGSLYIAAPRAGLPLTDYTMLGRAANKSAMMTLTHLTRRTRQVASVYLFYSWKEAPTENNMGHTEQ